MLVDFSVRFGGNISYMIKGRNLIDFRNDASFEWKKKLWSKLYLSLSAFYNRIDDLMRIEIIKQIYIYLL